MVQHLAIVEESADADAETQAAGQAEWNVLQPIIFPSASRWHVPLVRRRDE